MEQKSKEALPAGSTVVTFLAVYIVSFEFIKKLEIRSVTCRTQTFVVII